MSGARSKPEQVVAEGLGEILAGLDVGSPINTKVRPFAREPGLPGRILSVDAALEFFLPPLLRQEHESWPDGFDGFHFVVARKTGPHSAEFLGVALLITSQERVAMDLTLELRGPPWFVRRVKCKVGEPGAGVAGMATLPSGSPEVARLLARLPERREEIRWVFTVDVELPGAV